MLHIDDQAYKKMMNYCLEQRPHEACGFLTGREEKPSGPLYIERFIGIANRSPRPERHFDMDPHKVVSSLYAIRSARLDLLGIVHSHPQASPVPSDEDLLTPWLHVTSHWIVSLRSGIPEARAYAYRKREDGTVAWSDIPIVIRGIAD